jgi:hypothetical protein
VFDKREAFGVGDPAGVGGVVVPNKNKKPKRGKKRPREGEGEGEDGETLGRCCVCDVSDRRLPPAGAGFG